MNVFRRLRRKPTFSVVIATYNRDALIVPTLESVRQQSFTDFEVLVVSDGPPSDSLATAVGTFDGRFRLLVLPQRSRSQAGPNNLGWDRAKGRYIAYLGHDDIWHPEHLDNLLHTFRRHPQADFAVGGCLFLGPPGTDDTLTWVTGLFDEMDSSAPRENFFPPSSFAHRRLLPATVKHWSDPTTTRRPVDTEFILGAVDQGCVFKPSGTITVFKFASALRYLSYLSPEDHEQRQMLGLLDDPDALASFVDERVDAARMKGGYMAPRHATPDQFEPGEVLKINEAARGIALPPVVPLDGVVHLELGNDYRAFDWYGLEEHEGTCWRWSGPHHRPRLLIPVIGDGLVRVVIRILRFATPDIGKSLRIFFNATEMAYDTEIEAGVIKVTVLARLRTQSPSVLELRMDRTAPAFEIDPDTADQRRLGLCLSGVELAETDERVR